MRDKTKDQEGLEFLAEVDRHLHSRQQALPQCSWVAMLARKEKGMTPFEASVVDEGDDTRIRVNTYAEIEARLKRGEDID